jgi:hypothetical protein
LPQTFEPIKHASIIPGPAIMIECDVPGTEGN